ncbi:MAG: metal dependent phosphohydrolase with sensor [Herminiimonas sp.]|nr:metal dependent phosphohydrolase with sensor [Herminiimonas sp.]
MSIGIKMREMKDSLKSQTQALHETQLKLATLVQNGLLLASERDRTKLLTHILTEGKRICNADAATMYLRTEQETLRFAVRTKDDALPSFEIPLLDPATGLPNEKYVSIYVAWHNKSVLIDDVYNESRFDLSGTRRFDEESDYRTVSMLTVPLAPRGGEVIGVLQFMNAFDPDTGKVIPFSPQILPFIEALASQSAIALENQNLIDTQESLIDAMIKIIAGAIDAKSPYTGGHCGRVPELALMLAEEACKVTEGPLASFNFNTPEEWREFRIGAWLHDCGKLTTPDFVVDKATKLETIYNRIHEIRMRFEVLLRDAEIARLKAVLAGADPEEAAGRFQQEADALYSEFAFIAECNVGGESMAPQTAEKIRTLAKRTWVRHFDDRLGLSHEESARLAQTPAPALPAVEQLLSDKPHHLVPRPDSKALDPKYNFKMNVPEHLYNLGEIYNLSVGRGTLTEEERFKVSEHIIQTIVMLEELPFPKSLQRVPEYAGTHHETLRGSGYPRKLDRDSLSIPARIMAIADIFEALTAKDRPYKKAKTLSESIRILSTLKHNDHIDGDLFDLFLRSGLHLRYGERYLDSSQMDAVDIFAYVTGEKDERAIAAS